MKSMLAILLMALSATATLQQNRPVPVGVRQGEEAVQQGQSSVPPPLYQATGPNSQQLQREANELATLAHSIPPAVGEFTKGVHAKDLDEKLKRIEKISKRLRSELRSM